MNVRNLILGTMVSVTLVGCHRSARNDAHMELMGAQRRALEDRIYDLEFDHEDITAELEELQRENQQLREQLDQSSDSLLPRLQVDPGNPRDDSSDGTDSLNGVPRIKIDPETPLDKRPEKTGEESDPGQDFKLLPAPGNSKPGSRTETGPARVSHIVLNPEKTGIVSFDDQNNNDGVVISLEPRDQNDRYVNQSGALSIVVLDPTLTGQTARIARWDILQKDVQKMLAATAESSPITLELAWPGKAPDNTELLLFVRYQTSDGRKFETHTRITRRPGGVISSRANSQGFEAETSPSPAIPVDPKGPVNQPPPSIIHIPNTARSATSQPAAENNQRLQWQPYR